jgi:hypothetical protein
MLFLTVITVAIQLLVHIYLLMEGPAGITTPVVVVLVVDNLVLLFDVNRAAQIVWLGKLGVVAVFGVLLDILVG